MLQAPHEGLMLLMSLLMVLWVNSIRETSKKAIILVSTQSLIKVVHW